MSALIITLTTARELRMANKRLHATRSASSRNFQRQGSVARVSLSRYAHEEKFK